MIKPAWLWLLVRKYQTIPWWDKRWRENISEAGRHIESDHRWVTHRFEVEYDDFSETLLRIQEEPVKVSNYWTASIITNLNSIQLYALLWHGKHMCSCEKSITNLTRVWNPEWRLDLWKLDYRFRKQVQERQIKVYGFTFKQIAIKYPFISISCAIILDIKINSSTVRHWDVDWFRYTS